MNRVVGGFVLAGALTVVVPAPAAAAARAGSSPATWPVTVVAHTTFVGTPATLPHSPLVYGVSTPVRGARYGRLTRLDVATGALTAGPVLPAASKLFSFGSSLAILSPARSDPRGATTGPWSLRLLRTGTTSPGRAEVLSLPPSPYPPVVTGGPAIDRQDLWIGSGSSLFLVDAPTGRPIRHERLGPSVTSLSVDPAGKLLYVAVDEQAGTAPPPPGVPPVVVDELDARTGRVLAQTGIRATTTSLVAVRGGLWVSLRSGMAGTAVLFRAAHLTRVPTAPAFSPFNETIPTMGAAITMGIATNRVSSTVWLVAASGVSCVSPTSGRFRAGMAFTVTAGKWDPFTEWDGHLYAARTDTGLGPTIVSITPPPSCRPASRR